MVNISFLDNSFMQTGTYSTNPLANYDMGSISFGSNPFDSTKSLNDQDFMAMGLEFNNFSSDLKLFEMYMSNQMPLSMQDYLFSNSYNTSTDLAALRTVYNPNLGEKLANIAERTAQNIDTVGWCAKGANNALEAAGIANGETRVYAAYQEADVLANHKNFREVYVSQEDLTKLPAGCVIVWNRSGADSDFGKYGHIAITLGDGREASDHVQQLKVRGTGFRVFVPVGLNQTA